MVGEDGSHTEWKILMLESRILVLSVVRFRQKQHTRKINHWDSLQLRLGKDHHISLLLLENQFVK